MRTSKQEVARYTWLKTSQVAEHLGCDEDTVREHIKSGSFPDVDGAPGAIDIGAGRVPQYRIHPAALDAFLAARRAGRTEDAA